MSSRRRWFLWSIVIAIPALAIGVAKLSDTLARPPNDLKDCKLSHAVQPFDSLDAMPPAIARDLLARMTERTMPGTPAISARSGPFNPTDVIDRRPVPQRRFIWGGKAGDLWFIWYEHGGIGYHNHVIIYRLDHSAPATFATNVTTFPERLCQVTEALLNGRELEGAWPAGNEL